MFSFLARKKDLVGLDIGASSVKAVQVRQAGKGYELVHLGMAPLNPETIVDGVIMDGGSVISAIQQIYQEHGIKTKDVAVAVSGHSVIVKKIKMQQMKEEDLAESIQWEAEQYIPFAIEDVNLDFQILEPRGDSTEMDVLLVAVKKDVINDYLTVIFIVNDPEHFEEPFIRTTQAKFDPSTLIGVDECQPFDTNIVNVDQPPGFVPHWLPGQNPQLTEFGVMFGVPQEATRGGAKTLYPEYILELKRMIDAQQKSPASSR